MIKFNRDYVDCWKLDMKSFFENNQTFCVCREKRYHDMLIWSLRRVNDLIDKINNIVDVEQIEIDDKKIEFEIFKFCLKTEEKKFRFV